MEGWHNDKGQRENESCNGDLSDMKRQLIRCRIALIILLAGNVIQATVSIFR